MIGKVKLDQNLPPGYTGTSSDSVQSRIPEHWELSSKKFMTTKPIARQKSCPRCGTLFSCFEQECWCSKVPYIIPDSGAEDCVCPECLDIMLRQQSMVRELPCEEGDYYLDGTQMVFTATYHLKRGYCCRNGCRHCPYGFKRD